MKQCSKCNQIKDDNMFSISRKTCKTCRSQYYQEWSLRNKDSIKVRDASHYIEKKDYHNARCSKYYSLNKEKAKESRKLWKKNNPTYFYEYTRKNREKMVKYQKSKYDNDPFYKIAKLLRGRLRKAIKNNKKVGSAVSDLGCSIAKLKIHLQLKFHRNPRGKHEYMSWDNYGKWHIDHIIPLSKCNLSNREEFLKACRYTNLQPLWAKDNLSKGNR
jgi:hypothetical protein